MSNLLKNVSNIRPVRNYRSYAPHKTAQDGAFQNINKNFDKKEGGTNILEQFLQNQSAAAIPAVKPVSPYLIKGEYKNDLKTKFENNEAVIMGVILRSLGAKDLTGSQLIEKGDIPGTLVNAVSELDKLKALGTNTLHILPIHPPGKHNALGIAGSVYAPLKYVEKDGTFAVDPKLIDENPKGAARESIARFYKQISNKELPAGKLSREDQNVRTAELMYFIDECHKRGIAAMIDLASCASFDMFKEHPELMAFEKDGTPKTPQGWVDIRTFGPWKDESKRELNPHLVKMLKDFVHSCNKLGFDGIRADVSREKPPELWHMLIDYSHKLDPEFAWLAESYTYEDASPQINIQKDRPEDALNSGFNSIYGQWHTYHDMHNASTVINYIKGNLNMSQKLPPSKSLIGSFGTHDDISLMNHGGVVYCNHVSGLQAALPMHQIYNMFGFQTGDYYMYDFANQISEKTDTDSNECFVHKSKPDIFNASRPLVGKHPEIGDFLKQVTSVKNNPKYHDVLTKGSFIPLKVNENGDDQIIAFARHLNGKTLVFIGNKDVNSKQQGSIEIPGLKGNQKLTNLYRSYGESSVLQADNEKINCELGRGRVHLFEIDTPDIENSGLEVFRQNFGNSQPLQQAA